MKLIVKRIDKEENKKKDQKPKNRTKSRVKSSSLWSNEPFWIYFTLFTIGCLSMLLRTHKLRKVFNIVMLRTQSWWQVKDFGMLVTDINVESVTKISKWWWQLFVSNINAIKSLFRQLNDRLKVYLRTTLSFYENMKRIPSSVIQKFTPEQKSTSTFGRFEDDVYYIQSYFDNYFDNIF